MISTHILSNGLVVILEAIPHVQSVAYDLLIPGGILHDEPDRIGSSLILGELTGRGAGSFSSRELSDAFDQRGIRHGEGAGHDRYFYRGALLADELGEALRLVSMMVQSPTLPEEEIDPIRDVLLQDLYSLADSPARHAFVELHSRYYPAPFNRPSHGTADGLEQTSISCIRTLWETQFRPDGSVLSIAGNIDPAQVLEQVESSFKDWKGVAVTRPEFGEMPSHDSHHIHSDSAQVQIVLSYPSVKFGDNHYYAAKVANGVLSGGMFGRLFIEVREKRGLCYSVYSRHSSTESYGVVTAYAGTTPDRAQETLEVLVGELGNLKGTISEEELLRAKANMLSSIIIGEESPSSRASSNSGDWWLQKRIRSLDEIKEGVEQVTIDAIDEYLEAFPLTSLMLLTLGSNELTPPRLETGSEK